MLNRFCHSVTSSLLRPWLPHESTMLIFRLWLFFTLFSLLPHPTWGQAVTLSEIEELDKRFQNVSSHYYKLLAQQNGQYNISRFDQLSQLDRTIRALDEKNQHIKMIALITNNLALIENNTDIPSITYFIALLLEHNEWNSATALFKTIQQNSNKIIISNAQYAFAKYYFKRQKWKQTLDYLEDILADIVTNDAHYALLIKGISLQKLKKHRAAIKVYESIPNTSKYYAYATLNKAVAYIRQDWWTDAHLAINEILQQHREKVSNEMANRLFVVLGYSLMRKEYYRNARDTFRHINLDSQYANRALLGLALTAANQNDFIGAINAANILNAKTSSDLPSEESYLILPYIYSKFDQPLTASARFEVAIEHYTQRIEEIKNLLLNISNNLSATTRIVANNNMLSINGYTLDFTDLYPKYFLDNYTALEKLTNNANDQKISGGLNKLYSDYQTTLINMTHELLNQRINYLNSYIDQSRFGLARVYDNSIAE